MLQSAARRDADASQNMRVEQGGFGNTREPVECVEKTMAMIEVQTRVQASPERCFDLARDLDRHLRSMRHTGERVVGGRTSGMIGPKHSNEHGIRLRSSAG
jgi:hypothetical protein